jgi:hypothetical protein
MRDVSTEIGEHRGTKQRERGAWLGGGTERVITASDHRHGCTETWDHRERERERLRDRSKRRSIKRDRPFQGKKGQQCAVDVPFVCVPIESGRSQTLPPNS